MKKIEGYLTVVENRVKLYPEEPPEVVLSQDAPVNTPGCANRVIVGSIGCVGDYVEVIILRNDGPKIGENDE